MRAVDTGDRRARPGGGRLLPMLRDWLVETIPDQVADLRAVLGRVAARRDRHRPVAVGPDRWCCGKPSAIPVALSSTFMGPLIPGPDAPPSASGCARRAAPAGRLGVGALTRADGAGRHAGMRRRVDELRAQLRAGAAGRVGQPLHRAPAAVPGRQHPRARLRPPRPAGERPLRGQLHLAIPTATRDRARGSSSIPDRAAVGARHREHARLRRPVPAAHRDRGARGRARGGDHHHRRASATPTVLGAARRRPTCTSPAGSATASCCRAARRW